MGIKDFLISGFAMPKEVIWRAMLRLEGNKHKIYLLSVDEKAFDALSLAKDFSLPKEFHCVKHVGEKMVLSLVQNPDKPGEFLVNFVCPTEASGGFKKADI